MKHSVFHDGGGGHNGGHKSRMISVSSFIFKAFRHFALWEVVDKVVDTPLYPTVSQRKSPVGGRGCATGQDDIKRLAASGATG